MVIKIYENNYKCPLCGNNLESRFSKCFNIYCQGQKFNEGNLVIYRLNPKFEMGRVIKKLEIPASKSLEDEDTYFITKYKVLFKNNIIKTIHPIDLLHYIFDLNEQILTKKGVGVVNSQNFLTKDGKISYEILFPNGKLEQINENHIDYVQVALNTGFSNLFIVNTLLETVLPSLFEKKAKEHIVKAMNISLDFSERNYEKNRRFVSILNNYYLKELIEGIMMLADHIKKFAEYIQFLATKYFYFK